MGDDDGARELIETIAGTRLLLYAGDLHLFSDSSLPEYDDRATTPLTRRVLRLLAATG